MNIKARFNSRGRIIVPRGISLGERLQLESVLDGYGCLIWTGNKSKFGYGHIRWSGRSAYTHRLSYENNVGPIPAGMKVLHRCDKPACIDPAHLFLGTDLDNVADRQRKGRQAKGETVAKHVRGENSPTASLTNAQVRAIRVAPGPQRAIAARFSVCQMTVSNIKRRKLWAHLED